MVKIKKSRSNSPPGGDSPPDNCSEISKKVKKVLRHLKEKGRFIHSFKEIESPVKEKNFRIFEVEIMEKFFVKIKVFHYRRHISLGKGLVIVEPHAVSFTLEIDDSCSHKKIETCLREEITARRKGRNAERNFFIDVKEIIRQKMVPGLTNIVKSSELKDMNEHFDFILTYNGQPVEIEYKYSLAGQKSHRAKKNDTASIHYHRTHRYRGDDLNYLAPLLREICEDMVDLKHAKHL